MNKPKLDNAFNKWAILTREDELTLQTHIINDWNKKEIKVWRNKSMIIQDVIH